MRSNKTKSGSKSTVQAASLHTHQINNSPKRKTKDTFTQSTMRIDVKQNSSLAMRVYHTTHHSIIITTLAVKHDNGSPHRRLATSRLSVSCGICCQRQTSRVYQSIDQLGHQPTYNPSPSVNDIEHPAGLLRS